MEQEAETKSWRRYPSEKAFIYYNFNSEVETKLWKTSGNMVDEAYLRTVKITQDKLVTNFYFKKMENFLWQVFNILQGRTTIYEN